MYDVFCKPVQCKALLAGNGALVIMMRPRRYKKNASLGTCIKLASGRFLKRRKAILEKYNLRQTGIKNTTHHLFLARANTRRNKDSAITSH